MVAGGITAGLLLVGVLIALPFVLRSGTKSNQPVAAAEVDGEAVAAEAAPPANPAAPAEEPMPVAEKPVPAVPLVAPPEGELERLERTSFDDLFAKERLATMTVSVTDSVSTKNNVVWVHTDTYAKPDDPTGLRVSRITTKQFGLRNPIQEYAAIRRQQTGGRIKEVIVVGADGRPPGPDIHVEKAPTGESMLVGNWLGAFQSQSVTHEFQQAAPSLAGHFVNKVPEGGWLTRHPNGKLRVGGTYAQGQRHGRFIVHDEQGRRTWSGIYQRGELIRQENHRAGDEVAVLFLEAEPTAVAITTTGERAATAHRDMIAVWNAGTGEEITRIPLTGACSSLDFTPDGRLVMAAVRPDPEQPVTSHLYRAETGELLAKGLQSPRFSPDGRWMVSLLRHQNNFNNLVVWDLTTGQQAYEIDGTEPNATTASGRAVIGYAGATFSPTSDRLVVYALNRVDVFEVPTGQRTHSIKTGLSPQFSPTFCGDGQQLLAMGLSGGPMFIDLATGSVSGLSLSSVPNASRDELPSAIGLSADGQALAATWKTFSAMHLRVIDLTTGLCVLDREIKSLSEFPYSADGRGREITIPGQDSPMPFTFLDATSAGSTDWTDAVATAAAPRRRAVPESDLTVRIFEVTPPVNQAVQPKPTEPPQTERTKPTGPFADWHALVTRMNSPLRLVIQTGRGPGALPGGSWESEPVYTLACFNASGTRLVIAGEEGVVRHWSSNGKPGSEPLGIRMPSAEFLPDQENVLIFANQSGQVGTWDLARNKFIGFELTPPSEGPVRKLAVSPDGKLAASVDGNGRTVRVLDMKTRKEIRRVTGFRSEVRGEVWGVVFHADPLQLACYSREGVELIDLETGQLTLLADLKTDGIRGLSALPAPSTWSVLSFPGNVATFTRYVPGDPMAMQSTRVAPTGQPTGMPLSMAIFPDGNHVAIGDSDGAIALVETQSGKLVRVLRGHLSYVRGLAVSPDGRFLVSTSDDRTVRVWGAEEFPFNLSANSPEESAPVGKPSNKPKASRGK